MAFIPRDPYEERVLDGHIRNGWNDGRLGQKRTIGKFQSDYDFAYEQGAAHRKQSLVGNLLPDDESIS